MIQIIAEVKTVHAINQITLKKIPKILPSKDMPLSASQDDENKKLQGASDRPNVHMAINAFFLFAFHSGIFDIFSYSYP